MSDATNPNPNPNVELEPEVAGFAMDGITRLIAVSQVKSSNANDEAMAGATAQRHLIGQQRSLRAYQSHLDAYTASPWP